MTLFDYVNAHPVWSLIYLAGLAAILISLSLIGIGYGLVGIGYELRRIREAIESAPRRNGGDS